MTRKMKDSGIEWIGMIPEGWNVLKLKSCYSFGKGLSITKADLCEQGLGVISYGQVHSKDNIGASVRESLIRYLPFDHVSLSDNSRVSINDLIFADTSEDLEGCGNCIFIDSENVKYAGYHTIILHPKTKETSRYFGYLFATDAWKTQVRENASGVKVYSITQDMLKNAYLLAPPIETQYQIVSFLDAKCAEIDALIAAKEKSNTLLKEYRQSIIFEAVTKGLDPNAPMKDSGIEWIGMIPEGWDVLKLKSSYSFGKGLSITKADLCEQGLGLISYGQIHSKDNIGASVRGSLIRYLPFDHECLSDNSRVSINDIVFADTSEDLDGCGNCIFIDSENVKYAGYHTIILHPKTKETSRYFGYLFATDAWKTQIRENASGVKVYSITQDMLKNAYLLAPPIETQYQIVSFLDAKCAEIDVLIEANEKTINQLKEYRQSVIFGAVTGKMEV